MDETEGPNRSRAEDGVGEHPRNAEKDFPFSLFPLFSFFPRLLLPSVSVRL